MPKRQTILLILTGLAVAFGAFSLMTTEDKSKDAARRKSDKEFAAVIAQVDEALAKNALSAIEKHRMALIGGQDVADPFLKREKSNGAGELATRQGDDRFAYSGYVSLGKIRIAVINDSEYKAGEPVDDTGYVVTSITPSMVVLKGRNPQNGTMDQVAVPIQEDVITFAEEASE